MAEKYEQIRTQLQNKIFTPYGQTATHYYDPSYTYDEYGEIDATNTSFTEASITVVDYDIISSRLNYQAFGRVSEAESKFITPYTVSISVDDYVIIDGVTFKVTEVETPKLPEVVVNIVTVEKSDDTVTVGVIYILSEAGDNIVTEAGDQLISG